MDIQFSKIVLFMGQLKTCTDHTHVLICSYLVKSLPFNLWNASKYFKFSSCKFKFEKELHETARVYFQIKEDLLSFTCENSLGLYYDQKQTYQMCEKDYKLFGSSIIESFVELLTL